jgi:hypothetical protein
VSGEHHLDSFHRLGSGYVVARCDKRIDCLTAGKNRPIPEDFRPLAVNETMAASGVWPGTLLEDPHRLAYCQHTTMLLYHTCWASGAV